MSRRYITKAEREIIAKRANYQCEYCRILFAYAMQSFVNEHIISIKEGGLTELFNLAFACGGCNGHKADKIKGIDPKTGKFVSLFHPRKQIWDEHFTWSDDKIRIVGLTATGRATVETLKMNRTGLLNLRRLLLANNEHPPK